MRSVFLEFIEGKSDKFWEGMAEGRQVRVSYGRNGTVGQVKNWTFNSNEEALAHFNQVVSEKLRKGYKCCTDISQETDKDREDAALPVPAASNSVGESSAEETTPAIKKKEIKQKIPALAGNQAVSPMPAVLEKTTSKQTPAETQAEVRLKDWERFYNIHNRTATLAKPRYTDFDRDELIKEIAQLSGHRWQNMQIWVQEFWQGKFWSPQKAYFLFTVTCLYRQTSHKFGNRSFLYGATPSDAFMRESFTKPLAEIQASDTISLAEAKTRLSDIGEDQLLKSWGFPVNPDEERLAHIDMAIPLLMLMPTEELVDLCEQVWQMVPTPGHVAHNNSVLDTIISAYRIAKLPYLTDSELQEARDNLRKRIKQIQWKPNSPEEEMPLSYIFAGLLGLHDELLALVESLPNGFYKELPECGGLVRPQMLLFGLKDPTLIKHHFDRLNHRLGTFGDCMSWLAHMGPHEIEPVFTFMESMVNGIHMKHQWKSVPDYLYPIFQAHSIEAASAIFRLSLKPPCRASCMKWLDQNLYFTLSALKKEIEGKTKFAVEAHRLAQDLVLKIKRESLSSKGQEVFDYLKQNEESAHELLSKSDRPQWLADLFKEHPVKTSALPVWLTGVGHDPIVIEGYCLNNEEQVNILLAAKASTPDEIHPLLLKLRERAPRKCFDTFVWGVFERWLLEQGPSKDKWSMLAVGILASEPTVFKLLPLMKEWRAASNSARAGYGLECIKAAGTDSSLMLIHKVSQSASLKSLRNRAQIIIAEIAKQRNLSPAELEDRIIPTCGLDENGSRVFDFGKRRFNFVLGTDLKAYVKDENGKVKPDLPAANKDDDQEAAAAAIMAWKDVKKQVKAVAQAQARRLELAMIGGRRWSKQEFTLFFIKHPLMWHISKPLIWGVYENGKVKSTFRITDERDLSDSKEKVFSLTDEDRVGLVHPLELNAQTLAEWGQILTDYELVPTFAQLGRAVNRPSKEEIESNRFSSLMNVEFEAVYVPSVLEGRNWEREQAQDGGIYLGHYKYFPGHDITVSISYPGIYMGDPRMSEAQKIESVEFLQGKQDLVSHWYSYSQSRGMNFSEVNEIILSEVFTDLSLLASKGKKV